MEVGETCPCYTQNNEPNYVLFSQLCEESRRFFNVGIQRFRGKTVFLYAANKL